MQEMINGLQESTCSGVRVKVLFAMVNARLGILEISWQLTVDSPLGLGRRSHSWCMEEHTGRILSPVIIYVQQQIRSKKLAKEEEEKKMQSKPLIWLPG